MSGIVFQVETTRVLQLLTKEIYDSPLAMLRENVQNAYDAVRMRFGRTGILHQGGKVEIQIDGRQVTISDNGIGMSESVLRSNFWKAGSSGKNSAEARKSGVVGTFGIGAMANFGVCDSVELVTRAEGSDETLRSSAQRNNLSIGQECISLSRDETAREVGTTLIATLDGQHSIGIAQAREYIEPYVALLPVPIFLNGVELSGRRFEDRFSPQRVFTDIGKKEISGDTYGATVTVSADSNGQILANARELRVGGVAIDGGLSVVQAGGQLMGMRSMFGLAPVPAIGSFQFGGIADLPFLQPTAGREALTRDSIDQISKLLQLVERAVAEILAETPWADRNNGFLQWVLTSNRTELAKRVTIRALPDDVDMELGTIAEKTQNKTTHFYLGADQQIIRTFANEQSTLLLISPNNPRRTIHQRFLQQKLSIQQVPDSARIVRTYRASELDTAEAAIALKITSTLRDDYLLVDTECAFAEISHGVTIIADKLNERVTLYIARGSALLPPLRECYDKAYDVFGQFIKDFVRVNVYPRVQQFVPSSTRGGVEALRKILERNRELFRYEETDRGDLEGLLGEYLRDNASMSEVLKASRAASRAQTQTVMREQVGSIESVVPDVVRSPVIPTIGDGAEYNAAPPIVREDVTSELKILTADVKHPQLNNFTMFLGLSDKLMKSESEFFRRPHTTRTLWGGHRVIYIFTEATGRLSLYYDIELRGPLDSRTTGGGMLPTTTLITKKRIFVPIPDALLSEFKIATGPKEFYVRFDVLSMS